MIDERHVGGDPEHLVAHLLRSGLAHPVQSLRRFPLQSAGWLECLLTTARSVAGWQGGVQLWSYSVSWLLPWLVDFAVWGVLRGGQLQLNRPALLADWHEGPLGG